MSLSNLKNLYRNVVSVNMRYRVSLLRRFFDDAKCLKMFTNNEYDISDYSDRFYDINEIKSCIDFMKVNSKILTFPYNWTNKYEDLDVDICFDKDSKEKYLLHNGNKLYFPSKYSNYLIKRLYLSLIIEQDINSTHCYFQNFKGIDNCCFIDIGAAEGIVSLDIIDKVDKLVLIEGDHNWEKALHNTFKLYSNKVEIINKFASDTESDNCVVISNLDIINKYEKIVVKMDVEGSELNVLNGCQKLLDKNNCVFLVTVYHRKNDINDIIDYFVKRGYKYILNSGLMFIDYNFRKGVVCFYKD